MFVCFFWREGGGQKLIKQIIFHKINVFCDFYEDACEKLYCMVHCV